MTPGACLQAAIELLIEIETRRSPADDVVGGYFRRHRFAGVKDRGAISAHIFAVLRNRAALDWWVTRLGGAPGRPRSLLLAALVLVEEWKPNAIAAACDGDRFRPDPLEREERQFIEILEGKSLTDPAMPEPVRLNFPEWLLPHLKAVFGNDFEREMAGLNTTAPLDLRVNALKSDRISAKIALEREGVAAEETRYSPLGLRVFERVPLATFDVFREGCIEVQDEGSQLAALLLETRPGMRVVDFCAGAGGKTLALAAGMDNKGMIVACDISAKRLERAAQRLRRAGISIVQRRVLSTERDKWVKQHAGGFDRVFVDAPCTGTGTWRRNPDAKWRLTPQDLAELTELQARILDSAARLVKPGGRLLYATCSVLREEDEDQVEQFIESHPDFFLVPVVQPWRAVTGRKLPCSGDMLRLTPAKHGTDGFFAALLERRKPEPKAEA